VLTAAATYRRRQARFLRVRSRVATDALRISLPRRDGVRRLSMLGLRFALKLEGDAVYARVEDAHHHQSHPKVAHL